MIALLPIAAALAVGVMLLGGGSFDLVRGRLYRVQFKTRELDGALEALDRGQLAEVQGVELDGDDWVISYIYEAPQTATVRLPYRVPLGQGVDGHVISIEPVE